MSSVGIAELKARLSEYLRRVRRGHSVTIVDRQTPVARLVPYRSEASPLIVREPIKELRSVSLLPPLKTKTDSLAILSEERDVDR